MEAVGLFEGLVRCAAEGCISMMDMEIERRPYHRNCNCALHNIAREGGSIKACSPCGKLSYPAKRSWTNKGCRWSLQVLATH